jgi:hypothetical protein
MKNAKDKANQLWTIHKFYYNETDLISKQRIALQIAEIVRVLRDYDIEDLEYWNKVSLEIYRIND